MVQYLTHELAGCKAVTRAVHQGASRWDIDFFVYKSSLRFVYTCSLNRSGQGPMKRTVSISAAEAEVMEVLWQHSPARADEIITALARHRQWHESTIKTLLERLRKKGAIRAIKDGRRHLYSPVLKRDEWVSHESVGLLDRLFGGRVTPFVAHFSRQRKLTRRDIDELKRLIEELDDDR
jgi:BlaI family transcriptional regulator, penicillinase repressor